MKSANLIGINGFGVVLVLTGAYNLNDNMIIGSISLAIGMVLYLYSIFEIKKKLK